MLHWSKSPSNHGRRPCALATIIVSATLAISSIARAENVNRGTDEERAACTSDVFRLCSSEIPDVDRIAACLKANTSGLSEACRAVMSHRDVGSEPAKTKRNGR